MSHTQWEYKIVDHSNSTSMGYSNPETEEFKRANIDKNWKLEMMNIEINKLAVKFLKIVSSILLLIMISSNNLFTKSYSEGDAVIPTVSDFTLYTAKITVPAGSNGPPNSTYWLTAEEKSTELANTYSDTVASPPSMTAIHEFVVPKSMPKILPILFL